MAFQFGTCVFFVICCDSDTCSASPRALAVVAMASLGFVTFQGLCAERPFYTLFPPVLVSTSGGSSHPMWHIRCRPLAHPLGAALLPCMAHQQICAANPARFDADQSRIGKDVRIGRNVVLWLGNFAVAPLGQIKPSIAFGRELLRGLYRHSSDEKYWAQIRYAQQLLCPVSFSASAFTWRASGRDVEFCWGRCQP